MVDSANPPFDAVLWASLKTERLTGHGVEQVRDAAFDLWSLTAELGSVVDTEVGSDLTLLSELLEGTRTLIAIDNVETMGAEEIRDFIDAVPDAQFLLTSRVGLGEIEWRVSLGALGPSAAKNMLRHLANRRGLPQLARMSDRQATQVVERLRGSPLAIRWFVEAVQVGGQPDALLHDQSVVLQFCMSSIYDSLSEEGQRVVDCLVALDTTASVGQIALLTDLERDQVQQQIYELQRRSIVQVDSRLSETLTQSYAVSAMPREYLRRFGSLDRGFGDQVRGRLKEIEATDEIMRRYDNVVSLEPMAIMVETPEERAVANVLRQALRRSRQGDLEGARRDVARARDAAPAFFETYRVGAFIESHPRPEEARRLYEDAYRLAPPEGRPKVAYWLAGHLLSLMAAGEAEQFAREAHCALALPATALRLGRVCMYEGQRFDEAETLLKFAASADAAKTRLIAETTLIDLAKRRAERLAEDEKQPASALAAAIGGIRRAEGIVASGVVDSRFEHDFATLVSEALLIALRLPDIAVVSDELAEVLEAIDRSFRVLSRADLRETWMPRLGRICSGKGCPEEIVMYGRKLETRLERRLVLQGSGRLTGTVLEYSAKKRYGFIRRHDGEPNLFFHRTAVNDPQELILLNRGAEVSYAVRETDHQGETKTRATDVAAVLGEVERERALRRRRGRVVHRTETYLFTEDIPTQERVFVHRSALRNGREWASIRDGFILSYDLTFSDQGPIVVAGTAALDRPEE